MKRWAAILALHGLVLHGLLLPAPVLATQGESEWRVGLAAGQRPAGVVAGVEGGWLKHLTDFWSIGASLRDRRRLDDPARGLTAVQGDVRFVVDALQWIPALEVGIGPAWNAGNFDWLVRADASLGWRPARTWGLVLRGGVEHAGDDGTGWSAGLSWVAYRGVGIGLDL